MSIWGRKQHLDRAHNLLAGILNVMQAPAAVVDADLRLIRAGRSFCHAWGLTPNETEGRLLHDLDAGQMTPSRLRELLTPLLSSDIDTEEKKEEVVFELSGPPKICINARLIEQEVYTPQLILLTLVDSASEGTANPAMDKAMSVDRELRLERFCLEHAAVGIFRIDEEARILYVNDQACRNLGYTREELTSLSVFDIDHNFVKERWKEHRQTTKQKGSLVFETVHYRKDRSEMPVEVTVNYHEFEGEAFSISFVRDISKRKEYEEALELTQFTIDRASLACCWISKDGRFFYVNDRACRAFGYSRQELLQMSVMDINPKLDPAGWSDYWSRLARERVRTFETTHRRKDGSTFPVEINANYFEFRGMEYSCAFSTDLSERKQVEQLLQFTQFAIDRASIACFWMEPQGRLFYVNEQAARSLGYSRQELVEKNGYDIDPGFTASQCLECWQRVVDEQVVIFETTHQRKDGTVFPVEVTANYVGFGGKEYCCTFARDLTESKLAEEDKSKLESQLFQSQKMESIGRLAGGVAHDFNNMLGVILGYAELMKMRLAEEDPLRHDVMEIEKAAAHSKDITSQLLAFSRKQVTSPKLLDLQSRITNLQKTLASLIGEDVELQYLPGRKLWKVRFDPTQVEQILINLVINARDAMPAGGKLTIQTSNAHLDNASCLDQAVGIYGDFVQLSVCDNGIGMEQETLSKVFEPFFTTKEIGKGTGLGLATVYGIVKQGGGFINVYSEPAKGTSFEIYLPRADTEKNISPQADETSMDVGTETVLVVEDDAMVRGMAQTMLERIGYTVLAVETAREALVVLGDDSIAVDLLMTDVIMPVMNGNELYQRAIAIRPEIKTLFMSGYTANVILQHGPLDEGVQFIQKPFNLSSLARKIRKTLG